MTKHPHYTTSDTWGKLNLGQRYGILATDLDRALALVGLSKHEAIIVQVVRERCWGTSAMRKRRGERWPEPEPCEINVAQLAREVNPEKIASTERLLRRAKSTLLKKRVLTAVGDLLTLNKVVEEWPIDPAEIAYAAAAQTRSESEVHPDKSVRGTLTNRSPPPCQIGQGDPDKSVRGTLTNRSGGGHLEERARGDLEIQLDPPGVKTGTRTQTDQVLDQLTMQGRRITDDETDQLDGMVLAMAAPPPRPTPPPGVGNIHRRRRPTPRQKGEG